ncbi:hypothetical protein [Streptomonospora salina]|uniref:Uncharacterized protein n=1 Tax=Streptomonospora salina TaxID=104205 RepID=A0A841EB30_9ACTN|nr:hypothetical protein [Streptomonospora salina]MBB6000222.1 hypothetical protein [Streptomonospora salina]
MRAEERRRVGLATVALSQRYAASQVSVAAQAAALVLLLWEQINPFASIRAQWEAINDQAHSAVAEAQRDAALMALAYLQAHADACGVPDSDAPVVDVEAAVVGRSQTGKPLTDVLRTAQVQARSLIWGGMAPDQAWQRARSTLETTVRTEVADAAREVLNTGVSLDDRITGYERLVTLPACDKCLVLAGRFYRYSDGFERHPACSGCVHVPTYHVPGWGVIGGTPSDHTPDALATSLNPAERREVFGPEGAEAIENGASVSPVVQGRHAPPRRISRADKATAKRLGIEPGEINANEEGKGRSLRWIRARYAHNPTVLREELARHGWLTEAADV